MLRELRKHVEVFGRSGWFYALISRFARNLHFEKRVRVPAPGHPSRQLELRLGTSDLEVFREVFRMGEFDVEPPRTPRHIIDAGANAGFSTVFFALRYPDAHVLAVELESSNFQQLLRNVHGIPNVTPLHAALWKSGEMLRVVDAGMGKWAYSAGPADGATAGSETERVPGITVEELMARMEAPRIGLLKLDIEGGEREVLLNSARWIDKVDCLIVELHDRLVEGCSTAFETAVRGLDFERNRRGEKIILRRRSPSSALR